MVDYFLKEVRDFIEDGRNKDLQYPAIYPITLVFSRLLPYDFKNNYMKKKTPEEENAAPNEERKMQEERKFISLEEINQFLPLFREAANNKNYMGRLMAARAILPFVPYE